MATNFFYLVLIFLFQFIGILGFEVLTKNTGFIFYMTYLYLALDCRIYGFIETEKLFLQNFTEL